MKNKTMIKSLLLIFSLIMSLNASAQFFPQKRKNLDIIGSFPYGMHIKGHFSKTVPAGWYYNEWHQGTAKKKQKGGMLKRDGLSIVEIPACSKGMIGWTSNAKKLFIPPRLITIKGKIKAEKDYSGNYPRLFITYFNKKGKFVSVKFYNLKYNTNVWTSFKFILTPDKIPAKASTFRINFVSSIIKNSKIKASGKINFCDIFVSVPSSNGNSICLRGNKAANCWSIGEKITIKSTGVFPKNANQLIGHIFDSNGKKVSKVVMPISRVLKSGWQWKAKVPGLYQVKFYLQTKDKKTVPVVEDYMMTSWINANWAVFTKHAINVAVFSSPTRKPKDVPKVFGIHLQMPKYYMKSGLPYFKDRCSFIKQLEFNFIRYHSVRWSDIERKHKGDLHWEMLDLCVNWAKDNGYESIINFYGTAKWASSSKDNRYILGGKNYEAYAPAKMQDWEDFIKAMVRRYKSEVNTWEIWNEPHLPGSSCFWRDTPENFVKLLKSGYTTIKTEQPNSVIWLGGIAMRYLPFYDKILSLGAGKYFDRLSLHGDWPSPKPFYKIDDKYKSPRHKWVDSEWHAFLVRYSNPLKYKMSDQELSRLMLKDMMNQLKNKVERITIFNIATMANKEALEHLAKNGMPNSCNAGLIIKRPSPQPRFQTVAWQNFTSRFSGDIVFKGEYKLNNINAIGFESSKGKVIVLWHDGNSTIVANKSVKNLLAKNSKVITWEGKNIPANKGLFKLASMKMYYILDPLDFPSASMKSAEVLKPLRKKQKLQKKSKGVFSTKPLFDSKTAKLLNNNIIWNDKGFEHKKNASCKSRFAVAVTVDALELVVEVEDDKHYPIYTRQSWRGDGIQFALDLEGFGLQDARIEFYTKRSKQRIWLHKDRAPSIAGDLPSRWTPPRFEVKYAKVFIKKIGDHKMLYLIRIPNSELYPYQISEIKNNFRFSLLINDNDNDNKGRKGWIEWGSGIGKMKDPILYGTLYKK